jgi:ubiquinone/menaquinone biosynthesis C-methylase UbiE
MPAMDPFGRTDRLDDAMLEALVSRFEARGKHARFAAMLQEYLEAMKIPRDAAVLDLGCGTGLAARAIARSRGFSGRVIGVDLSPYFVAAAGRLANEEGVGERVEFRSGDARSLGLADASFDAVVAHTLLSHVEDPLSVLKEAARVAKPGAMVGVFDGDYASLTFDQADAAKGKADDEALIGAIVTNPRVMRQLPRLLRAAGLELVASFPNVLTEIGTASFWASGIQAFRRLLPRAGAMTEHEANAWADGLLRDSEAGVFFGSSNYYAYVARRAARTTPPPSARWGGVRASGRRGRSRRRPGR